MKMIWIRVRVIGICISSWVIAWVWVTSDESNSRFKWIENCKACRMRSPCTQCAYFRCGALYRYPNHRHVPLPYPKHVPTRRSRTAPVPKAHIPNTIAVLHPYRTRTKSTYLHTVPVPKSTHLRTVPVPKSTYLYTVPVPQSTYRHTVPVPKGTYHRTVPYLTPPDMYTVPPRDAQIENLDFITLKN